MKGKTVFSHSRMHLTARVGHLLYAAKAAGVLFLLPLIFSRCGGETKAQKEKAAAAAAPVPVVVAPAIQKTVPIYSEYTAQADARDTVELRARVEAFLEKVHFDR